MQSVEIRIKGHIDEDWSERFEGFVITHGEEDETTLMGTVVDQAAAHGTFVVPDYFMDGLLIDGDQVTGI